MTTHLVELQVMFDNPSIPNFVLLTEHDAVDVNPLTLEWIGQDLLTTVKELRQEAERRLGTLKSEQVFYRLFPKPDDQ